MSKVCVITGASAGIGAALARTYAKADYHLALLARRQDKLEQVQKECLALNPNIKVICLTTDVKDKTNVGLSIQKVIHQLGEIDILIANAGFAVGGPFHKLQIEDYQRQFETNVNGVINCIYAGLESLKRTKGRLAILGSVNSYVAMPTVSPYSMSKFAIRALAECLYYELKIFGISTTLICPGFVESEIRQVDNNGVFNPNKKDWVTKALMMPADTAAKQILNAIEKRKKQSIITMHGKFAIWLQRHFPFLIPILFRLQQRRAQ